MKHLSKRIAALAMALAMTLTLTTWASAADYADMPENWAKAPVEAAVEAGLLQGSDGLLRPTDHLTRAEMAAIVVRAFGATQSADVSKFSDVDANAWYVAQNAVPGAVFMQIMKGNANGTFEPGKYITREQAFAILARALKLEAGDAAALEKFSDAADVSSWATGEVAALAAAGYVNGSDGKLNPQGLITRQEFAQVMYNIFGSYIKEAGTYSEVGERTLMISADGVTIEDATIHGDVIIGEGVGEGDVYFKNVTIEGRVVVRGGGVNSIHFINSDTAKVLVSKIEGAVRVVTDKASSVAEVAVVAGQDTVTVEGSVDKVAVEAETPVVVKDAEVKTVEVKTDSAKVEITGASKVEAVSVTADAQVGITGSSNVTKVEAASGTVTAGGEARVSTITTTGGDVKVEDTARVTTIEAPKTEDGAPAPTVTIADTATVSTVKAETDVTLDGKANRVEAPKDVTVSDSNGNEVATTTPGGSTGPSYPSGGGTTTPEEPKPPTGSESEDPVTKPEQPTIPDAADDPTQEQKPADKSEGGALTDEHTEHQYPDTPTSTKPATCSEFGEETYKCTGCDNVKTVSIAKIAHTPNTDPDDEKAATCVTDGYKAYNCSVCGAENVKVDTITKTGNHNYSEGWTYDNDNHWHQCTVCGDKNGTAAHKGKGFVSISDTQHKGVCECGKEITAAHGTLTDVANTAVAATCAKDGKEADQKCPDCNYVKTGDTISKDTIPHTFKPESKTGKCEVCKTAECPHTDEKGDTCTKCGVTLKTEPACSVEGCTCTDHTNCGKATGSTCAADCTACTAAKQEACGEREGGHTYAAGTCSNCGKTITADTCPDKDTEHSKIHTGKTCPKCGYQGQAAHSFVNGANCSCGETGTPHQWESGTCNAAGHSECTCDHSGDEDKTDSTCSVCGGSVTPETNGESK